MYAPLRPGVPSIQATSVSLPLVATCESPCEPLAITRAGSVTARSGPRTTAARIVGHRNERIRARRNGMMIILQHSAEGSEPGPLDSRVL
jgi:hypothetical protein